MHRRRPSPATMIACLALFVALGGTAIAASRYLITRTSQIEPSVLSAIEAPPGPELRVSSPKVSVKPGAAIKEARAVCPSGYHIITGGYSVELASGAYVVSSEPFGIFGWSVLIDNEKSTGASHALADALCGPGRTFLQLEN